MEVKWVRHGGQAQTGVPPAQQGPACGLMAFDGVTAQQSPSCCQSGGTVRQAPTLPRAPSGLTPQERGYCLQPGGHLAWTKSWFSLERPKRKVQQGGEGTEMERGGCRCRSGRGGWSSHHSSGWPRL